MSIMNKVYLGAAILTSVIIGYFVAKRRKKEEKDAFDLQKELDEMGKDMVGLQGKMEYDVETATWKWKDIK